MLGQQLRHVTGQPVTEQNVDGGDVDHTGDVLGLLFAFQQHRLDPIGDGVGMRQEHLSCFGWLIAGMVTDEHSDTQRLLGCRQPPAHSRRHQAQVARRLGHVA
ncbi:hypothetical protein D3C76_1377200 [compost metagenome]